MLILSVNKSIPAKTPDKSAIKALYNKQKGQCFYCGFNALLAMQPSLDADTRSWVLSCPICYDVLHLDEAAINRPHGKIIEESNLSQVKLNFVMHTVWATQHFYPDDFSKSAAATIWNNLNQLTHGIEHNFSKGASKIPVIASVLESLPEKQYDNRINTLKNALYLPSDLDYKPQVNYWADEVYSEFVEDLPRVSEVTA